MFENQRAAEDQEGTLHNNVWAQLRIMPCEVRPNWLVRAEVVRVGNAHHQICHTWRTAAMPDFLIMDDPLPLGVILIGGLLLAVFWVFQFAELMSLDNDDFPAAIRESGLDCCFHHLLVSDTVCVLILRIQRQPGWPRDQRYGPD